MKKRLNFILAGLMVFVLAMTLAYPSWAEDLIQPSLESKLVELIDSQNKLTATLQKAWEPKDQFKIPDSDPQQLGGDGTKFPPALFCTSDYQEWPSSGVYKESDWPLEKLYGWYMDVNGAQYIDVNGDGLTDQLYLNKSSTQIHSCLYLNNGRGWDLAHKCYANFDGNPQAWKFYGDCAKTE